MKASVSYLRGEAAQETMIREEKRLPPPALGDDPIPSGLRRTDEAKWCVGASLQNVCGPGGVFFHRMAESQSG